MLGWPCGAIEDSPSLEIMPGSQYIGVILIEGKSPVFCLRGTPPQNIPETASGYGCWENPTEV